FKPYLSIITSVGYDHPDTYSTEDDYKSAFRQFIQESTTTVIWQTDSNYIVAPDTNTWRLQDDEVLQFAIPGEHNRRNATLVFKALERLGIGQKLDNLLVIEKFPGTDRRFEKLADNL